MHPVLVSSHHFLVRPVVRIFEDLRGDTMEHAFFYNHFIVIISLWFCGPA